MIVFRTRRQRRRAGIVALAVASVLVGVIALPGSGFAQEEKPVFTSDDPKEGSNAAAEVMKKQEPLMRAGMRLSKLDDGNLGGVRINTPENAVHVWWKGSLPPAVQEEVDRQRKEYGITVTVDKSRYSEQELTKFIDGMATRWVEYPELVGMAPAVDGSGVIVYVNPKIEMHLDLMIFPPGSIVQESPVVHEVSRNFDIAPWWAGSVAQPVTSGAPACSVGFAVVKRSFWIEYSRGVITAEHCARGGRVAFDSGSGIRIGTADPTPTLAKTDALYIPTSSGPRTYDGGVGVNEFSKAVVGVDGNLPGQSVCTSGAATGANCNIQVDVVNFQHILSPSGMVVKSTLATQLDGGVAVGNGDSGGPVIQLTAADLSKVRAVGMINGGVFEVGCGSFGTTCFRQVTFTNIYYVLGATGGEILTW